MVGVALGVGVRGPSDAVARTDQVSVRALLILVAGLLAVLAQLAAPSLAGIRAGAVSPVFLVLAGLAIFCAAFGWSRRGFQWTTAPPAEARAVVRPGKATLAALGIGVVGSASVFLRLRADHGDATTLLLWLGAILAVLAAFAPRPSLVATRRWLQLNRADLLVCWGLAGLAVPIYLWGLDTVPWRVQADEAAMGAYAAAYRHPNAPSIFATGWLGHPNLFFYLQYLADQVAGWGLGGIRAPAAISGVLMVLVAYGFGRVLFGRFVGLVAGVLTATSVFQITYARLGLNNAPSELVYGLTFLLLAWTWRTTRPWPAAAAGVAAGFGLYLYFGSRMLPLVGLGVLVGFALFQPAWRRARGVQIGAYLFASAVTLLPQALDVARNPAVYLSRFVGLSVASQGPATLRLGNLLRLLGTNALQSFLVFFHVPDQTFFFYGSERALLDAWLGPFIILGIGLTLARLDDPRMFLCAAWFWPNWVAAGVVLMEVPYSPRLVCVVGLVIILASVALVELSFAFRLAFCGTSGRAIGLGLPLLLAVAIGYREITSYLGHWSYVLADDVHTEVARFGLALGPRDYVFVEGGGTPPAIGFVDAVYGAKEGLLPTWPAPELQNLRPGASIVFYFWYPTDDVRYVAQVEHAFPGGRETRARGPRGDDYFVAYDTHVPGQRNETGDGALRGARGDGPKGHPRGGTRRLSVILSEAKDLALKHDHAERRDPSLRSG